ncbi:MAG: hypothetical protein HQL07_12895 [Nitrospirae bacterium]|nr:hypothetical protein [Magnetococcales bacterium]
MAFPKEILKKFENDSPKKILERLKKDRTFFRDFVYNASELMVLPYGLDPYFSRQYTEEVYDAWIDDLKRVSRHDMKSEELDHFKHASHLCFWIRRMGPILELMEKDSFPPDSHGDKGRELDLITKYRNEYLAFRIGLTICGDFEPHSKHPKLTYDYIASLCRFMRYKHVSPHALFLIYKSLFSEKERPYFDEYLPLLAEA